ncbi:MAG: MBL fold metallo-hydrolase [Eubacteriaceae bacterium]|nr:MBL fold metallo-hydrolase [Eubacteriaceae bacterium]MBQ1466337.1 MBL fold metallo-hydrolase [Eubacteriaceae bacterium]
MFGFTKVNVNFIANAGVMIYTNKQKILIDGLHRGEDVMAGAVDEDTINEIISATGRFKAVDMMLFSHEHLDHFNPSLTARAMEKSGILNVMGTKAVIDHLRSDEAYSEEFEPRIWCMDMAIGLSTHINIRGINIEAIGMEHDAIGRDCPVNNSYLFTIGGKTFLHVGDAKGTKANFEDVACLKTPIDVMFVPFTYVGIAEAREAITALAPKKLVIMHMPDAGKDDNNWAEKAHMAYTTNSAALPPTVFFEKPGDGFTL